MWYPKKWKKMDPETRKIFDQARKEKKLIGREINCPICYGKGEKYDSKKGAIRDCAGCKGTGRIRNPKHKQ